MSNSIDFLLCQASRILESPTPNYANLHTLTSTIERKVSKVSADNLSKVTAFLKECKEALKIHADEVKTHTSWQELGFPPEFIQTFPDCVDFLVNSGVAYQIACFRNSPSKHADKHTVGRDADGHPMILIEGKMTRWEEVKGTLEAYKDYNVLRSRDKPEELWTYISPLGITKHDIFRFSKPFCVDELPIEYVTKLQEYSKTFYSAKNPDPSPDVKKPYVLQICTSTGVLFRDSNRFLRGLFRKLATHYGIRIITPNGEVYSFGYRRDVGERAYLRLATALGQVKGRIALNDFEESRPHDGRYITTIPLSESAARIALNDIVETNERVPSFDWLHDNCIELTMRHLRFAGVNVQTQTPLEICIQDLMSGVVKNIPTVGPVIARISRVAKNVFNKLPTLPAPVRQLRDIVVSVIFYVPAKIGAIAKYIFVWAMGWTTASPTLACVKPGRSFSIRHALNESYSNVHYPRKLLRWQKQQSTTHCHEYKGVPTFAVLPPA